MGSNSEFEMMGIPYDFFLGEERDGFYIPGMIKKAWAVHISNYKNLEAICESLGIHCSPTWGTLLGAVREGGIIPWDDDIDTEMLRKDYEVLKNRFNKDNNIGGCFIRDYRVTGEDNMVRSWWDNEKSILRPELWKEHFGFPYASAVDIFLLDRLPKDDRIRKEFIDRVDFFVLMKNASQSLYGYSEDKGIDADRFEEMIQNLSEELGENLTDEKKDTLWIRLLECEEDYIKSVGGSGVICDRLAMIPYYRNNKNRCVSEQDYDFYIDIPFEFTTVSVPVGYDDILRRFYGEYYQPDVLFDAHGNYPFYKRLEDSLRNEYGVSFFRYDYDPSLVKKNKSLREAGANPKDKIDASYPLFHEAHEYLSNNVQTMSSEELAELLEQCQKLAIETGETIENEVVDSENRVRILEEYCECVFRLYEKIISKSREEDDINEDINTIVSFDEKFRSEVFSNIKVKRKVLILAFRDKNWPALHMLWKKYDSDPEVCVTVIPVPYYRRSFDGEIERDTLYFDTDGFPSCVNLTNFDEYDVQKNHPDEIIYQNPYDEYEEAISIHPYFYSSNMHRFTKKMTFVPPFVLNEIEDENKKSRYTLSSFLCKPGLIYADCIYAQSESMKRVYASILSDFTGEEVSVWNDRIDGGGIPLSEWKKQSRLIIQDKETKKTYDRNGNETDLNVSDEKLILDHDVINRIWSDAGSIIRICLFRMSISTIYSGGLNRIEEARKLLLSKSDNVIVWSPDPNVERYSDKLPGELYKAYCNLMREFGEMDRNAVIIGEDERKLSLLCDVYIGDPGTLMNQCRIAGKTMEYSNI